jgi:hypothetical protein
LPGIALACFDDAGEIFFGDRDPEQRVGLDPATWIVERVVAASSAQT